MVAVLAMATGELEVVSDTVERSAGIPPRARDSTEGRPMAGELAFIEIGVRDPERGRAFYEGLFGWEFEPGPSSAGFAIRTPNVRGGLHGDDAGASPYVFFRVDDLEAALERVRELGGEIEEVDVEGDEESVARFGRFKLCRDDQGSAFGLHQPPSG